MIKAVRLIQRPITVRITSADTVTVVRLDQQSGIRVAMIGTQGPPGRDGRHGAGRSVIPFAFNNVAEQVIHAFVADGVVLSVMVNIDTPFDGDGAQISVGTHSQPDLLVAPAEIDVSQAMTVEKAMVQRFASGSAVKLFITPGFGGTRGTGNIVLEVI